MRIASFAAALGALTTASLAVLSLASCAGKIDAGDAPSSSSSAAASAAPALVALTTDTPLVDWGYLSCGATATRSAHLANVGNRSLRYTLRLGDGPFSLLGADTGTLAPGARVDVGIRVTVARASSPRVPIDGVLAVDIGEGAPLQVRLRAITDGAVLTLTPSEAAFGPVVVGDIAAPIHVDVANNGYVPIAITFAVPTVDGFGLSWTLVPTAITLGPHETETVHATFAPSSAGPKRFAAQIHVEGAVCGAFESALILTGEGIPPAMDAGTH